LKLQYIMIDFFPMLPVVKQDPTDPAFVADPYKTYTAWRSLGEFVYWADYDMPMATTCAAVTNTLKSPGLGRAVPDALAEPPDARLATFSALERHSLLELEAPDHTRIRREALKVFQGPGIATIAPIISTFADALISDFPSEPFDLLELYAKPLAAMTIAQFLGVDTSHAAQLQTWSNDMVAMYQARRDAKIEAAAETASREFSAFMRDLLGRKRHEPQEDFLSHLAGVQAMGGMSDVEVLSTSILLLNAGHEATAHSIGNAVPLLLDFNGRAEALAPESIAGTVEECLRFRPPLHLFKRYVYKPTVIEGVRFETNHQVGCLLGSASRDDAVWPDSEVFNPFRPRIRHLAFGVGLHACLGAALARLELQIALPALFSRCPGLRIVTPPKVADLYHFHGYERLMVSLK
jgi:unspecific monooxygenase